MSDFYWGSVNTENNDNSSGSKIEATNNHIYFYSDINNTAILDLIKNVSSIEAKLIGEYGDESPPIKLHIHSYGGSVLAGWAGMDSLLKCRVPIYTYVEGACASAATFLSVIGKKRYIGEHGYILIHQISGGALGTYSKIVDVKENYDMFMKSLKEIYCEYTKVPQNELDGLLNHDLWWNAKTCLKYNLVDYIL